MASEPTPTCWICGQPANTREHRVKASDIRSVFGVPTKSDPIYFHTDERINRRIDGIGAGVLKFANQICGRCNNATTQPHDRAWQWFSERLRSRTQSLKPGDYIRPSRIFPYNSRRAMLNVHLYFVKIFGCQIVEGAAPIDLAPFSAAILGGVPHPMVYLAFGPAPTDLPVKIAGASQIQAEILEGRCVFATWIYHVGNLWVNIVYAIEGQKRNGLKDAWHPRFHQKRLRLREF